VRVLLSDGSGLTSRQVATILGRAGTRTHQLVIAVLGAAQHQATRRAVGRTLVDAALRRGPFEGSVEELTPLRGDPRSAVPLLAASAAVLARPAWWSVFSQGAVSRYALTPEAWAAILGRRSAEPP